MFARLFVTVAFFGVTVALTCDAPLGPCGDGCNSGDLVCINNADCCHLRDVHGGEPDPDPDCKDKINPQTHVSDCPKMANYCNNPAYHDVMEDQCPKTCGYCGGPGPAPNTCQDLINPKTGYSDCPQRKAYCDNPLMTEQCPRTCNRCPQ
ncbi:unnamed protein product, partial [Mesorhabditis spiculigera]